MNALQRTEATKRLLESKAMDFDMGYWIQTGGERPCGCIAGHAVFANEDAEQRDPDDFLKEGRKILGLTPAAAEALFGSADIEYREEAISALDFLIHHRKIPGNEDCALGIRIIRLALRHAA